MAKTGKHHVVRKVVSAAVDSGSKIVAGKTPMGGAKKQKSRSATRWTAEEIERLCQLVSDGEQPPGSWVSIASHFPGRNAKQCRERWCSQHALADRKKGNWTAEEDGVIAALHKKFGNKWSKIAASMPGRTDNDVKNRWWSQERARKRSKKNVADEESNAADSSKEKSIHKERPKIAKPIKRDLTHKTKQALESTNSLYKREFDLPALPTIELCPLSSLSDELLMDILIPPVPRLGTCPSSIMSNLETDAATSLVALKSGRTPVEGSDYKEGNDPSQIRLEPTRCEIATPNSNKWSYPSPLGVLNYSPKSFDNNDVDKENLAPTLAVSSSSLNIPNLGYVRKWTYPPPPSPMLQARPHLTVKASEIFSPSYGTIHKKGNSITPPSTLPLDTLPLCDSGPFIKRTTMPMDQAWPTSELRIKWSPLVTKNNRDTTCLFSPLPVSERSETNVKPNHFSQTVTNVFESDSFSNKCFLRPSPVKSSKI